MSSSDLNQPPLNDPPEENTTPFESKECREGSGGGAVADPVRLSFQPREGDLIGFFLFNKVAGKDDVSTVNFPECDLYGTKYPWEIWQEFLEDPNCEAFFMNKSELYLFTTLKKKDRSRSRFDRTVGLGTWKRQGAPKPVFTMNRKAERVLVGSKVRYRFEMSGCERHHSWIMMEYTLDDSLLHQISNPNKDLVICKIKKNERTVQLGTGEKEPLELKDSDAATEQRNGDESDD